jgi:hypothetical protein
MGETKTSKKDKHVKRTASKTFKSDGEVLTLVVAWA